MVLEGSQLALGTFCYQYYCFLEEVFLHLLFDVDSFFVINSHSSQEIFHYWLLDKHYLVSLICLLLFGYFYNLLKFLGTSKSDGHCYWSLPSNIRPNYCSDFFNVNLMGWIVNSPLSLSSFVSLSHVSKSQFSLSQDTTKIESYRWISSRIDWIISSELTSHAS